MKKIVVSGPESSGKTTLSRQLAAYFGVPWVKEFARDFLDGLGRPYLQEDLLEIAKGQLAAEQKAWDMRGTAPFIICDTGMLGRKVWSEYKYGNIKADLLELFNCYVCDAYILCGTEVPWEYDPLRESQEERDILYEIYKKELISMSIPFLEVSGKKKLRLKAAKAWIPSIFPIAQ